MPARFDRVRLLALVAVLAVVLAVVAGCNRDGSAAATTPPSAAATEEEAPTAPVVRAEATSLLFSFVDAAGRMQAVPSVADVPEAVRRRVLVVDLAKTPEERQAHRYAFFADLTAPGPDGTFPVVAVSRYDAARGQGEAPPSLPPADGSVVVYSAEWCGYCKKAKTWLTGRGVPFIERDVEKTAGAQAELQAKLRAANVPGGGVPVIDWGGSLVMGFDVAAFERLLQEKPPVPPAPPSE
jgi:glutaredoxin